MLVLKVGDFSTRTEVGSNWNLDLPTEYEVFVDVKFSDLVVEFLFVIVS